MRKRFCDANRLLLFVFAYAGAVVTLNPGVTAFASTHKESKEFKQFLDRVQDYVRLRKSIEATLPVLKPTDIPANVRDNILSFLRKRVRRMGALLLYIVTKLFA